MRILFLGYLESPIIEFLKKEGHSVKVTDAPIADDLLVEFRPEFIVSYGYRHIVPQRLLCQFEGKAVNLHISYLPWNRGADPNFWSFVENTPKGVSIHYMDKGIDTGRIIVQKKISFSEDETLKSSYDKLQQAIQELFSRNWKQIADGSIGSSEQCGRGSFHKSTDKTAIFNQLKDGWDTPVAMLENWRSNEAKEQCTK